MEGEIHNSLVVWGVVITSLCYCHSIGRHFPAGKIRQVAIIPVAILFFLLPLCRLTSVYLGATTFFFVGWLANFKLLLFAFGQGPLISSPPLPLSRFIALACLPIKFQNPSSNHRDDHHKADNSNKLSNGHIGNGKEARKSLSKVDVRLNYALKLLVLFICIILCNYSVPKIIFMLLYCLILYLPLELFLAIIAALARTFMKVELDPQFDEPLLATSLQDFWGRRWNLMVSNILRPTVYLPIRSFLTPAVGREFATIPATFAGFLVSGLMHELILHLVGRQKPTGEMTCFFLVNGVLVGIECVVKRATRGRQLMSLPRIVSTALTLSVVLLTSSWLFFPPVVRSKGDIKGCNETLAIIESLKTRRVVSPTEMHCGTN